MSDDRNFDVVIPCRTTNPDIENEITIHAGVNIE
jgi:hypothetical protein